MSNATGLSITTPKTDLTRALAVAKVTASPDKTLPLIHSVNLAVTDRGNTVVQSTDRYIAARAYLKTIEDPSHPDWFQESGLTLGLPAVGLIQKWLTLVDKYATVSLTSTAEHCLTVSAPGAPTLSGIEPEEGKYPPLDRLIRSGEAVDYEVHDRAGAVILAARNVSKLGTISHHCKGVDPVLLRTGMKTSINDLVFRVADGDDVIVDGIIVGLRSHPEYAPNPHGL